MLSGSTHFALTLYPAKFQRPILNIVPSNIVRTGGTLGDWHGSHHGNQSEEFSVFSSIQY